MKDKKTYYIITIGCAMNKSDSERIAAYLEERNFILAKDESKADLVVFTTCGVRQSAEDRAYGLVNKVKKKNKKAKIILTGCLSERSDVKRRLKNKVDIWLNINDLSRLGRKLGQPDIESSLSSYLKLRPKYDSKFTALVPIGNGCNNFCAYCVVPYARGREVYRSTKEILDEVKGLVKNGYKEIILIAQNVNSYKDEEINFSKLLKKVNNIPGEFWIRFSTSHPKDMSDELIKIIAKSDKICKHIHLPAQAGDDKILKAMNRKYDVIHYKNLIKKIRKAMPEASITTDIIIGFPGETEKQFSNTRKLFKECKFDMAYISKYSSRPGTVAAKLEDNVSLEEKKKREKELMNILRRTALANNKKYVGEIVDVLVSGKSKIGEWLGYTGTGKNVRINLPAGEAGNEDLTRLPARQGFKNTIGNFVKVKIIKVKDFGLTGEIL